ncbi:MAG: Rrf2 family transcriptional regulator, nitric oxide-sensitive transcriptional repressor [Rhodobacteraceae bacterium HLUCCA08]|nr:MAG: Rrf2 family transcriptional regulator, nitric oxide-sensitive transcriptional repressor [Rhodobacteraceae bacterium HLUCCA08]
MRLTIKTNLAMRTLMFCAVNADRVVRKAEVAAYCNASEAHLGVVINQLGQTGFIETIRGRGGGIRLKTPADQITVGQVFRVFESGVPFAECFDRQRNTCPISTACRLRGLLCRALDAFYAELDLMTLEQLVAGNTGLERVLELAD